MTIAGVIRTRPGYCTRHRPGDCLRSGCRLSQRRGWPVAAV